jgi:hypothetical protein
MRPATTMIVTMYGIESRICGGKETPRPESNVVAAEVIPKMRAAPNA